MAVFRLVRIGSNWLVCKDKAKEKQIGNHSKQTTTPITNKQKIRAGLLNCLYWRVRVHGNRHCESAAQPPTRGVRTGGRTGGRAGGRVDWRTGHRPRKNQEQEQEQLRFKHERTTSFDVEFEVELEVDFEVELEAAGRSG